MGAGQHLSCHCRRPRPSAHPPFGLGQRRAAVGRASSRRYGPPKIDGMTQTAFDMTRPLRSRWDQEGAEFVQSNNEWCARACARLLALNSQLQAADTLQLVQEWSLKDDLRALSPELVAEDATRARS